MQVLNIFLLTEPRNALWSADIRAPSRSLALSILPHAPHYDANHNRGNEKDSPAKRQPLHQQGKTLAKKITEHGDYDRPYDGPSHVVRQEHAPEHLSGCSSQGACEYAEAGD